VFWPKKHALNSATCNYHRLAYIGEMSNQRIPEVEIVYEDENCLAVNKPAGIMVHSDGRAKGPFLTDWIIKHYPKALNVGDPMKDKEGNPVDRSGVVHRLDRETSGVLLIAKTAAGHASLKKQFQARTIAKKYIAYVWGEIEENFGLIDRPIGRSSSDFRKYSAQRGAKGVMRVAETYWTRKAVGTWKDEQGKVEKFTFVEAEPKTGRTHQIRVHLNAINHPVVGDILYAPKRPMALGFKRLALHSNTIEFDTLEGKRVKVVAPIPEDFVEASKALEYSTPL